MDFSTSVLWTLLSLTDFNALISNSFKLPWSRQGWQVLLRTEFESQLLSVWSTGTDHGIKRLVRGFSVNKILDEKGTDRGGDSCPLSPLSHSLREGVGKD